MILVVYYSVVLSTENRQLYACDKNYKKNSYFAEFIDLMHKLSLSYKTKELVGLGLYGNNVVQNKLGYFINVL